MTWYEILTTYFKLRFIITKAVTQKPAEVMKKQHELGSLSIGVEADVSVLKLVNALDTTLGEVAKDSHENVRVLEKRLIPVAVFRAGKPYLIEV